MFFNSGHPKTVTSDIYSTELADLSWLKFHPSMSNPAGVGILKPTMKTTKQYVKSTQS